MEAKALLNALVYTQAEVQPQKFGERVADLEVIAYTMR